MKYIFAGIMPVFLGNAAKATALAVNEGAALAAGMEAVDTQNAMIAAAIALATGVLIYIKRHRRFKASDE